MRLLECISIKGKALVFGLLHFVAISSLSAQLTISEARQQALGTEVSVRAVVLNGSEMGSIRYLQDATAGIAAYPGTGSIQGFSQVERADSVLITGILTEYNGLLELNPITDFEILASGLSLPQALHLPQGNLSEELESRLVQLPCGQFDAVGNFSSGTYGFHLPTGEEVIVYISGSSPLVGQLIPSAALNLTGIVSEYNGQYQLLPRDMNDLAEATSCLFFLEQLRLVDIQPHSLSLYWKTSVPAQGGVYYGTQANALNNYVEEVAPTTDHYFVLEDLEPATFYYLRVQAESNGQELSSPVRLYATASLSSGSIEVYFNQWTEPAFSTGSYPDGDSYEEVEAAIIERIDAAQSSISVCMYNVSRTSFIEALTNAQQRGVIVRYIADSETTNSALQPPPPFPVLYGSPSDGIMHNKTLVIDPDDPQGAYVITGSMNMTFSNVINAFNNTLIIQDQTLARAYLVEFNEMWGSTGEMPNLTQARFGAEKEDNTPRAFRIGEATVDLYFSPSDGTSQAILEALQSADESLDFALLLFTKNELGDALLDLQQQGVALRGMVENVDEWGTEFYSLQAGGVPIYEHWQDGMLHHKYAIVDEGYLDKDPLVITGSHNWTNAADAVNDENTLILHSAELANIFRQEFEARWGEVVGVYEPVDPQLRWRLYPNPATAYLGIAYEDMRVASLKWSVSDFYGRVWLYGVLEKSEQGYWQLPLSNLPKGCYVFRFFDGSSRIFVKE